MAVFCSQPGCTGIALEGRFCASHVADNYVKRRDRRRENPETRGWYDLACWRSPKRGLRAWKLMQDPLCQDCKVRAAWDVHHLDDSWREGGPGAWEKFMDRNNLQSLCHQCHSRITATREMEKKG